MDNVADELDRMADLLAEQARHFSELAGGLAVAVGQLKIRARELRNS